MTTYSEISSPTTTYGEISAPLSRLRVSSSGRLLINSSSFLVTRNPGITQYSETSRGSTTYTSIPTV